MTEKEVREEMVRLGASLFERGLTSGNGGNMSARLEDGTFIATPTRSSLGRLRAERLSHVNLSGELLDGDRPSSECAFHLNIYKARPDCGAIVHLHSTHATALACCEGLDPDNVIKPFTPYYVMQIAPLPLVPYHKPGSQALFDAIASYAPKARCLLLANHGLVTTGASLEKAVNKAEELEETARLFFLRKGSGSRIKYLSEQEISQLKPID